jgi:hypothetical protein
VRDEIRTVKRKLLIMALVACAFVASADDKPPDLTGAPASSFKANLGHVVILRGSLEDGKEGFCLFAPMSTNVVFYIIPHMPPTGIYSYPASWERFRHQQVRVTGELKFSSFDRTNTDHFKEAPSDHYYMVLQQTSIERIETK